MYQILSGQQINHFAITTTKNNTKPTSLLFLRNCGFGVGLGQWKKKNLTQLVQAVAQLKANLNQAIYCGGILGYLNNKVRKPLCEIEARMHYFLFGQYQVLKKEYNMVVSI